jgi:hypothetical protein
MTQRPRWNGDAGVMGSPLFGVPVIQEDRGCHSSLQACGV